MVVMGIPSLFWFITMFLLALCTALQMYFLTTPSTRFTRFTFTCTFNRKGPYLFMVVYSKLPDLVAQLLTLLSVFCVFCLCSLSKLKCFCSLASDVIVTLKTCMQCQWSSRVRVKRGSSRPHTWITSLSLTPGLPLSLYSLPCLSLWVGI